MKKVIERLEGRAGELQLQKNGEHYEIIAGGIFLMSTCSDESEKEMVRIALSHFEEKRELRVLIGGLGVGYSVMEASLDKRVKKIDVVELEEAVIRWNKQYLKDFNNDILDNERVRIICNDLLEYIRKQDVNYELVVLDVDNGPDWLVREENRCFYEKDWIFLLKRKLSYGGIIAVWSSTENTLFEDTLKMIFEECFFYKRDLYDNKGRIYYNYLYFGKKSQKSLS